MAAIRVLPAVLLMLAAPAVLAATAQAHVVDRVRSKDGTQIAVECAGNGPELLIVHGGTGNRARWLPMFPYFTSNFTVCAMDRRGHGESGDGSAYSLEREAEDIVAVVKSRKKPVAVLGHSFGAVGAYEAAFLTKRISRLILYEPPIGIPDHSEVLAKMDVLIRSGARDEATRMFFREIVQLSPDEIDAMRKRPAWKSMVGGIEKSMRQDRALTSNGWDAARAAGLKTSTLLLLGSRTANPELKTAIRNLATALPDQRVVVLEGQEHNAMDTGRDALAVAIKGFLQSHR
jgi:pimeloyl-ACP methyl ester carboxylesterase